MLARRPRSAHALSTSLSISFPQMSKVDLADNSRNGIDQYLSQEKVKCFTTQRGSDLRTRIAVLSPKLVPSA